MKRKILALCWVFLSVPVWSASWSYSVRPGDTLWDLCLKYTNKPGCWQQLGPANNVSYPRRLPPGFVIQFPVAWLKQIPTPATVVYVNGEANAQDNESSALYPLVGGEQLPIGAKIITGEGLLNIRFADGNELQIEPHSELLLDALSVVDGKFASDSKIRLNRGGVKTRVPRREPPNKFQITTPTAVAAVRGTNYRISLSDTEAMRGEVFEGLVAVDQDSQQQAVPAGYGIVATKGQVLSAPKPLLPAPAWTTAAKVISLPYDVSWEAMAGAQSYQLDLLVDNDNEQVIERWNLNANRRLLADVPSACYRLQLRAIDNDNLQGLAAKHRFCLAPAITSPEGVTFVSGTNRDQLGLTWQPVEQATRYRVILAADKDFMTIVATHETTDTQWQTEAKAPVYVRVIAIADDGRESPASTALYWQPGSNPLVIYLLYGLFALVFL